METCMDFLSLLELDMSLKVLMYLDDPSDLVRVSSVSCSWRHYVIANGLCKQLCLRMFPQLSSVVRVADCGVTIPVDVGSSSAMEWESLEREHRVYAFLVHALVSSAVVSCISDAISASSTDNYPEESIYNTLEPRDRIGRRGSYWSSEGKSDPAAVETLIYKLVADLCVVTEIKIQPFQAYFQSDFPIYSAKSVRFRMGHCKSSVDEGSGLSSVASLNSVVDEILVWTYTSQEFPMAQENCLQTFKLPEPVLCVGGMLQIELLGRVQRQEMDGLFYTCIAHVQVVGRLSSAFNVQILEPCGNFLLQYYPRALDNQSPSSTNEENQAISVGNVLPPELVRGHLGGWEQILHMLRGDIDAGFEWNEEEEPDEE